MEKKQYKNIYLEGHRRGKGKRYWDAETDKAVVEYNFAKTDEERNRIYEEKLHYPFSKLVENVFNVGKFQYCGYPQDAMTDALAHLVTKVFYLDPTKGKPFAYATLMVKHHFIQKNIDGKKALDASVMIAEPDDEGEENNRIVLKSHTENNSFASDFFPQLLAWWEEHIDTIFRKPWQKVIAREMIKVLTECPEQTNKKAIYLSVRERTKCKTVKIGQVVSKMKPIVEQLRNNYLRNKTVEMPGYPAPLSKEEASSNDKKSLNEKTRNIRDGFFLTADEVMEIRRCPLTVSNRKLAKDYKCSATSIKRIRRGEVYPNLIPEGWTPRPKIVVNMKRKFSPQQVQKMREDYFVKGISCYALANIYQSTPTTICHILRGQYYKEVPGRTMPKLPFAVGERYNRSPITDSMAREIFQRYHFIKGITHRKLSIEYGISRGSVQEICNRTAWKHATEDLEKERQLQGVKRAKDIVSLAE